VPSFQVWSITQVVANALIQPMVQQCVLNQSKRHWLFFNVLVATISFVCQFQTIVWHLMQVEPMILMESFKSFDKTCKNKWHILNLFHSFMVPFQKAKTHNMLALMLNPHYKGLGFIQYVDKERAQRIVSEYDHQIMFPFLVCAYNFSIQVTQVPKFLTLFPKFWNHKYVWPLGN